MGGGEEFLLNCVIGVASELRATLIEGVCVTKCNKSRFAKALIWATKRLLYGLSSS